MVADGDTVELLAMQRASISVAALPGAPPGGRRWRLTVQRPDRGDELRRPGDLKLQARATIGALALWNLVVSMLGTRPTIAMQTAAYRSSACIWAETSTFPSDGSESR